MRSNQPKQVRRGGGKRLCVEEGLGEFPDLEGRAGARCSQIRGQPPYQEGLEAVERNWNFIFSSAGIHWVAESRIVCVPVYVLATFPSSNLPQPPLMEVTLRN